MGKWTHNASKHQEKEGSSWGRKELWLWDWPYWGAAVIAGMGFVGCHKPPMFCGGGFGGEDFPQHVLERIDAEVQELNLTETQQARYREIRARLETELIEVGSQRKAFFEKVKAEMDREAPDLNVLSALVKSHLDNFPVRAGMFIDDFMAFYNVLDENQKRSLPRS